MLVLFALMLAPFVASGKCLSSRRKLGRLEQVGMRPLTDCGERLGRQRIAGSRLMQAGCQLADLLYRMEYTSGYFNRITVIGNEFFVRSEALQEHMSPIGLQNIVRTRFH